MSEDKTNNLGLKNPEIDDNELYIKRAEYYQLLQNKRDSEYIKIINNVDKATSLDELKQVLKDILELTYFGI